MFEEQPELRSQSKDAPSTTEALAKKLLDDAHCAVVKLNVTAAEGRGVGSGFFIDKDHVVTNMHVVSGMQRVEVVGPDGKHYPARIERLDDINDLAVLKLPEEVASTHGVLALDTSVGLKLKDPLFAVGHPMGVSETKISAGHFDMHGKMSTFITDPKLGFWPQLLQDLQSPNAGIRTDANAIKQSDRLASSTAIKPGNSGGPLINSEGKVVGIVANSNSREGVYALSVPVEKLKTLLEQPPKFEFEYENKSRFGLSPVPIGLGTLVSVGAALKLPRIAVPAIGAMTLYGAAVHTSELLTAHDQFQFRCSAFDLASDALTIGGVVASLHPKTRAIGYACFGVGVGSGLITSAIPRYETLTSVRRMDGEQRLPYRWRSH